MFLQQEFLNDLDLQPFARGGEAGRDVDERVDDILALLQLGPSLIGLGFALGLLGGGEVRAVAVILAGIVLGRAGFARGAWFAGLAGFALGAFRTGLPGFAPWAGLALRARSVRETKVREHLIKLVEQGADFLVRLRQERTQGLGEQAEGLARIGLRRLLSVQTIA